MLWPLVILKGKAGSRCAYETFLISLAGGAPEGRLLIAAE
jgi:hypothetical protein